MWARAACRPRCRPRISSVQTTRRDSLTRPCWLSGVSWNSPRLVMRSMRLRDAESIRLPRLPHSAMVDAKNEPGRPAPEVAEALWTEALADAGMPRSEFHRLNGVSVSEGGTRAQWFAPEELVSAHISSALDLSTDDWTSVDLPPLLQKHRIVIAPILNVQAELVEAAFAAKVRHEIEHARQSKESDPEIFRLSGLTYEIWRRESPGTLDARRPRPPRGRPAPRAPGPRIAP
jgi:hypothetical protein